MQLWSGDVLRLNDIFILRGTNFIEYVFGRGELFVVIENRHNLYLVTTVSNRFDIKKLVISKSIAHGSYFRRIRRNNV